MFRITDRSDMTLAVYRGRKTLNQTNKTYMLSKDDDYIPESQSIKDIIYIIMKYSYSKLKFKPMSSI